MEAIILTTIPPFQVVSHVIKKPPSFSLRGRRLKGKGEGVLCARETRRAREEGERETAFPSLPPSSRPKPPFPSISNACHAGYQVWTQETHVKAKKKWSAVHVACVQTITN